ncbi:MAG: ATP-dependent sacrificial sulfur transferase LarE [Treponemataceae bacterium]
MTLQDFFTKHNHVALGFSGGVDSSYLLYEGIKNKAVIKPYFIKTQFQPTFELHEAQSFCKAMNIDLTILEYDILQHTDVTENPENRCYFCKRHLFSLIQKQAQADGFTTIIDGTNASDDGDDRPGMKVLKEMNVLSPLQLCGITKDAIRAASKKVNLPTWNKPAYACLATRIPALCEITKENLATIESAENKLFKLGFNDFRIRYFNGAARIQMTENQFIQACQKRNEIYAVLKPFFNTILLDLQCR